MKQRFYGWSFVFWGCFFYHLSLSYFQRGLSVLNCFPSYLISQFIDPLSRNIRLDLLLLSHVSTCLFQSSLELENLVIFGVVGVWFAFLAFITILAVLLFSCWVCVYVLIILDNNKKISFEEFFKWIYFLFLNLFFRFYYKPLLFDSIVRRP